MPLVFDEENNSSSSSGGSSGGNNFTIIYPNGGSAESPANIDKDMRYEMDNPFPSDEVDCLAEVLINGVWGATGWANNASSTGSNTYYGTLASLYNDKIVVRTGLSGVIYDSRSTGNPHNIGNGTSYAKLPCRVKVWRINN